MSKFLDRLRRLYGKRGPIGFGASRRKEEYFLILVKVRSEGEAEEAAKGGAHAVIIPEGKEASLPYGYIYKEGMEPKGGQDFMVIEDINISPPPPSVPIILQAEENLSEAHLMGMRLFPIEAIIMRAERKLSSILEIGRAHILSEKPIIARVEELDGDMLSALYSAGVRGIMTELKKLPEIKSLLDRFEPRRREITRETPLLPPLKYEGEDYENEEDYP